MAMKFKTHRGLVQRSVQKYPFAISGGVQLKYTLHALFLYLQFKTKTTSRIWMYVANLLKYRLRKLGIPNIIYA